MRRASPNMIACGGEFSVRSARAVTPPFLLTINMSPAYSPVDFQQETRHMSPARGASQGKSAKTEVLQGTLDLMVLKTLEALGPLHGYGIARRLEQASEAMLSMNQGTLYPALIRLEQRGWISSRWGVSESNRRAKYYSLTRAGARQLAAETRNWERVAGIIARLLKSPQRACDRRHEPSIPDRSSPRTRPSSAGGRRAGAVAASASRSRRRGESPPRDASRRAAPRRHPAARRHGTDQGGLPRRERASNTRVMGPRRSALPAPDAKASGLHR